MEEVFKDIEGYEGQYQISNLGRKYQSIKIAERETGISAYKLKRSTDYRVLEKEEVV